MAATTFFAPQLYIKSGTTDIDFYIKGLGAEELRRWSNDDGSIHVAELSLNGTLFHLHEESERKNFFPPEKYGGTTVNIGLFVADADEMMNNAIAAGAEELTPAQDYDYGYRQGEFKDPFGHVWTVQKAI